MWTDFAGEGFFFASTLTTDVLGCNEGVGFFFPAGGEEAGTSTGRFLRRITTGFSSLPCSAIAAFFLLCFLDASQGAVLSVRASMPPEY